MAETAAAEPQQGSRFGFLGRKLGPLPVWGWGLIAVGVYYWYSHYGPGASKSSAAQPVTQQVGFVEGPPGPRGNVGPAGPPGPPRRPAPRRRRRAPRAGRGLPKNRPPIQRRQAAPAGRPVRAYAPQTAGAIHNQTGDYVADNAMYATEPTAGYIYAFAPGTAQGDPNAQPGQAQF
jgi:hypothetical protein